MLKNIIISLTFICSLMATTAHAVIIYHGETQENVDQFEVTYSTMNIQEHGIIADVDFYYSMGDIYNIVPNYSSNVSVTLTHAGKTVLLYDAQEDFDVTMSITFDDEADSKINTTDQSSYSGVFRPTNFPLYPESPELYMNLSAFDGTDIHGDWTLGMYEALTFENDGTDLLGWKLLIDLVDVPEPSMVIFMLCIFALVRHHNLARKA